MSTTLSSKNWGDSYILSWAGPFVILTRLIEAFVLAFAAGVAEDKTVVARTGGDSGAVPAVFVLQWNVGALAFASGGLVGLGVGHGGTHGRGREEGTDCKN